MGKSRLVAAARTPASVDGFLVLESGCFEPDRSIPSAPIMDLLRAHLSPELTARLSRLGAPTADDPEQERHLLYQELLGLLSGLARSGPVLLIVEDLHWCDDTSLSFLLYLARRVVDLSMLLLVTNRTDEPQPGVHHILAELDRQHLVTEFALAPLTRAEVEVMPSPPGRTSKPS